MKRIGFIIAVATFVFAFTSSDCLAARDGHCYQTKNCSGDIWQSWIDLDSCAMSNGQSWKGEEGCYTSGRLDEIRNSLGYVHQMKQQSTK